MHLLSFDTPTRRARAAQEAWANKTWRVRGRHNDQVAAALHLHTSTLVITGQRLSK